MGISVGDTLPDAALIKIGDEGPETVELATLAAGKKVVIFAVPGAYTPTCSSAHMPSFVRNAEALREAGVDEIVCVSVNDPFVMKAWATETHADQAEIHALSDADGAFTKAIGMDFTAEPVGLLGRSKRYAMVVEDGKVTLFNAEENPGVCELSAGETILEAMS
ncbi:MAG: peroxiredoxin [Pseudomonadota bacterium]